MTDKDNGGPAFPTHSPNPIAQGMTMRDWFAGQALTAAAMIEAQARELARLTGPKINWRDDPTAIVEDDEPQTGRDYE